MTPASSGPAYAARRKKPALTTRLAAEVPSREQFVAAFAAAGLTARELAAFAPEMRASILAYVTERRGL